MTSLSLEKQFLTYYILPSTPHVDWASHEDSRLGSEFTQPCTRATQEMFQCSITSTTHWNVFLFCGNHINHYPKNGEPFRLNFGMPCFFDFFAKLMCLCLHHVTHAPDMTHDPSAARIGSASIPSSPLRIRLIRRGDEGVIGESKK